MQKRDELGGIYTDEMFADLYPEDGQPAIRPWRLVLVTIMQFGENLTVRQAADDVRAGVEGTISQAAFTLEARRARYRGMLKVHLQQIATSTAINLLRVIAWLNEVPRSITPQSHFARLVA